MLKYLDCHEFTKALNMYRNSERDSLEQFFHEDTFSAFIQSAIRVGKIDVVERMLRAMKRHGLLPSLRFWQTSLKMLCSRKLYSSCVFAYQLFGRQIPVDKMVFSCLINAALESDTPERATSMLERYQEADLSRKDYVLIFRVYVALDDVDAAEALFRKRGPETTSLMLNLLISICVKKNLPHRALQVLEEAHSFESLPERIVDIVSYNTLMKGFAQARCRNQCFECFQRLLKHGLKPDEITVGTLLEACIAESDLGMSSDICDMLLCSGCCMDMSTSCQLIKSLVRAGCLSKAMDVYSQRQRDGSASDLAMYFVLIKAHVEQKNLEQALALLEDLKRQGLRPDDLIITHLLDGCRHENKHELGKMLFQELLSSGLKPSEFTLVTMLKLHGRCGAHQEAYDLVKSWEGLYGMKPSVIHFTCLMSGCLRTKSYDQAWAAYELMLIHGVQPDDTTIATLLPGMVMSHQWEQVLLLARRALMGSSPVGFSETLNSALSTMLTASTCEWRIIEQLQGLMKAAGVPITARNQKRLA